MFNCHCGDDDDEDDVVFLTPFLKKEIPKILSYVLLQLIYIFLFLAAETMSG